MSDILTDTPPDTVYTAWTGPRGYQQRHISSNLSWNTHVDRITANAGKSLGFIKHNIETKSPQFRKMAYQFIARPQQKYASPVWNPNTKDKTHKVELGTCFFSFFKKYLNELNQLMCWLV